MILPPSFIEFKRKNWKFTFADDVPKKCMNNTCNQARVPIEFIKNYKSYHIIVNYVLSIYQNIHQKMINKNAVLKDVKIMYFQYQIYP